MLLDWDQAIQVYNGLNSNRPDLRDSDPSVSESSLRLKRGYNIIFQLNRKLVLRNGKKLEYHASLVQRKMEANS